MTYTPEQLNDWANQIGMDDYNYASPKKADIEEQLRAHAALLADAPDVEGLVKRVNAGLALPIVSVAIADVGRLVDALLSQQARIRALEDQVANLKAHAEAMAKSHDLSAYDYSGAFAAYRRDHPEGT